MIPYWVLEHLLRFGPTGRELGQFLKVICILYTSTRRGIQDWTWPVEWLHEVCTSAKCKKPFAMRQQDPVPQADQRNGQNRAPIGSRQTDTNRKICEWIKHWLPPAHMFLPIACAVIYKTVPGTVWLVCSATVRFKTCLTRAAPQASD